MKHIEIKIETKHQIYNINSHKTNVFFFNFDEHSHNIYFKNTTDEQLALYMKK